MTERLLIIGAHPDDPACWGGTLSRFCREGWKSKIYICSSGTKEHIEAYKPWCTEVVAKPIGSIDASEEGQKSFWELVGLIKDWKPKVIITHDVGDRFTSHQFIARKVQEAAYMAYKTKYPTGEMECWGGDADWEGPILQYPNIFVRINQKDLDAKIKMLIDTTKTLLSTAAEQEHLRQWCESLARFRSVCIHHDKGFAEAYKHDQPRII